MKLNKLSNNSSIFLFDFEEDNLSMLESVLHCLTFSDITSTTSPLKAADHIQYDTFDAFFIAASNGVKGMDLDTNTGIYLAKSVPEHSCTYFIGTSSLDRKQLQHQKEFAKRLGINFIVDADLYLDPLSTLEMQDKFIAPVGFY